MLFWSPLDGKICECKTRHRKLSGGGFFRLCVSAAAIILYEKCGSNHSGIFGEVRQPCAGKYYRKLGNQDRAAVDIPVFTENSGMHLQENTAARKEIRSCGS